MLQINDDDDDLMSIAIGNTSYNVLWSHY
jgi:hypothetical protein